jgi:hypothetical protein
MSADKLPVMNLLVLEVPVLLKIKLSSKNVDKFINHATIAGCKIHSTTAHHVTIEVLPRDMAPSIMISLKNISWIKNVIEI